MSVRFQQPIHTAALIGKYNSPDVAESLPLLARYLRDQGVKVLVEERFAGLMAGEGHEAANYEIMGTRADVAIVLGGDGTMLYAARRLAEFGVPTAGVNQGRLGFMTDIARDDMLPSVQALLEGKFSIESRILLDANVWRGEQRVWSGLVFNEVVVNKGDLGRMIEMRVEVDGEFLYLLRADGLIIATPTGSTAYALAANGPILHPGVAGLAIVPLCSHALSNRPITISDRSHVDILMLPSQTGRVHVDGQQPFDAIAGDRISIGRSEISVTLLHPPTYSYFAMLREKLHWSEAPKQ